MVNACVFQARQIPWLIHQGKPSKGQTKAGAIWKNLEGGEK